MTISKRKNTVLLAAVIFLFLALFDGWQYGFFTMLRFVVFAATAYVAWLAYKGQKEKWVWVFGFIAVLFNPLIPIYLNRETWTTIDLIVGLFLLLSIHFFKLKEEITLGTSSSNT